MNFFLYICIYKYCVLNLFIFNCFVELFFRNIIILQMWLNLYDVYYFSWGIKYYVGDLLMGYIYIIVISYWVLVFLQVVGEMRLIDI